MIVVIVGPFGFGDDPGGTLLVLVVIGVLTWAWILIKIVLINGVAYGSAHKMSVHLLSAIVVLDLIFSWTWHFIDFRLYIFDSINAILLSLVDEIGLQIVAWPGRVLHLDQGGSLVLPDSEAGTTGPVVASDLVLSRTRPVELVPSRPLGLPDFVSIAPELVLNVV